MDLIALDGMFELRGKALNIGNREGVGDLSR